MLLRAQSATADPEAGFTAEREAAIQALGSQADVYARLVASLAPSIWELEDVKKGILCQLFGGCVKRFQGTGLGKGFRGDINVLLARSTFTGLAHWHQHAPAFTVPAPEHEAQSAARRQGGAVWDRVRACGAGWETLRRRRAG